LVCELRCSHIVMHLHDFQLEKGHNGRTKSDKAIQNMNCKDLYYSLTIFVRNKALAANLKGNKHITSMMSYHV
jgi:hypothetical protein